MKNHFFFVFSFILQGMEKAWSRALGKTLNQSSQVCELHFAEEDIVRCQTKKNCKGKIILQPGKLTRLKKFTILPKIGEFL